MAISSSAPRFHLSLHLQNPNPNPKPKTRPTPTTETLRRRLLRKGVTPTPKVLHALRKKEALKSLRRAKKEAAAAAAAAQNQSIDAEEAHFRAAAAEYRALMARPWDGIGGGVDLRGVLGSDGSMNLGREGLEELREMLAARKAERFQWLLDDDVEVERDGDVGVAEGAERRYLGGRVHIGDEERIELLVKRLGEDDLNLCDWRFTRLMKQANLLYNEMNLLKIVEGLGACGNWRQALSVVEWVYNETGYKHRRSRFVYTKLLSVLGKAKRPTEALRVFTIMRGDAQTYPDMAAYHTIAVTLGQAGLVNELIKIIEYMRQKPSKKIMNMRRKDWDPTLEPDVVIYNSVLNACIPSQQWKGVFWVFQQIRIGGLKPTGATYGLAMEVMLNAKKYDFVQKFFEKMRKNGLPPKALTYKVLVRAFREEGKVDKAVEAVKDMEERGVVGAASVYYELACCLCNSGRWQDAILQVEKLKHLPLTKSLEVAFTGMILASFDGGYIAECILIFESMKDHCNPNIGTINAMLKVYGRSDMFAKAKELFGTTTANFSSSGSYLNNHSLLKADAYTYGSMLEAAASAHQWEYFEYVYREMALSGYHLDQRKYSWLLIKASRAGKFYLLEHVFDAILEKGEIPDVPMFTEMICQTIVQNDYGRTLQLMNGMVQASIKVSEVQWTCLLQQNMDRFSKDALQNLLNNLSTCDTITEDPVPSFLRSLRFLCGIRLHENPSLLADGSDASPDQPLLPENANKSSSSGLIKQDQLSCENSMDLHVLSHMENSNEFSGCNGDTLQLGGNADTSSEISLCTLASENEQKEQHDPRHRKSPISAIDEVLDSLNSNNDSLYAEMPSASEILKKWKQERMDDVFACQ